MPTPEVWSPSNIVYTSAISTLTDQKYNPNAFNPNTESKPTSPTLAGMTSLPKIILFTKDELQKQLSILNFM